MFPPIEQITADGYDLQFGTNVLGLSLPFSPHDSVMINILQGHFYFTKLLLPTLLSTAKSSPDKTARVINTSSMGHGFASGIDFDSLKDGAKRKKLGSQKLYCQSKFVSDPFMRR
jgi:NAD(P)-dependent dehydrogenase (short-subunit alcohol dehydrogenase family)